MTAGPLILYVDDELANRLVFDQALKSDFNVKVAANAEMALKVFETDEVAVIVTDMRMPTMSGEDLLRIVKERSPQTIRIVITAFSDVEPILRAINEGLVARYIIKPWVHEELVQVLRWAVEAWTFGRDSAALHRRLLETERLATLGSIAGAVIHDLKQPVQAMLFDLTTLEDMVPAAAALKRLLDGKRAEPNDQEVLRDVADNFAQIAANLVEHAELLQGMVMNLRQYTRPAQTDGQAPTTDPLPIIRHAIAVCEDLATRSRSKIDYSGPPQLPRVKISTTELSQVLINLVANAAQAVDARGQPDGRISIRAHAEDGALVFEVSDDGIGMPPEVLARVGTPFFTTRKEGTGLGLAQCQRLIGTVGGRFRIESEQGVGTTVTITLPTAA